MRSRVLQRKRVQGTEKRGSVNGGVGVVEMEKVTRGFGGENVRKQSKWRSILSKSTGQYLNLEKKGGESQRGLMVWRKKG